MAVAEKRTQVYFPTELYRKIERKARKESKSMAAVVREAVEKFTKEEEEVIDWENDPIFKLVGIAHSGVWLEDSLKLKAWEYFKKHSDKKYSFTDCTSFVLMKEMKINHYFAFDDDFSKAGFVDFSS